MDVLLVTGGYGFIGSNFINMYFDSHPKTMIVNVDIMRYCARVENVRKDIRESARYVFFSEDICDTAKMLAILNHFGVFRVIHFAAQSHVDTSFSNPLAYTTDNTLGTHCLLEACRKYGKIQKFVHVSTDEVYGESMLSAQESKKTEESVLCPTNPYAASKAGAELIAQSYYHSFGFPIIITRGNNVYGPNQYPEKLIPKFIERLLSGKSLPIQGTGEQKRAFLHVDDVCKAFECILEKGQIGEVYNIGSDDHTEFSVLEIAKILIAFVLGTENWREKITFVEDRPFNDKRYYISNAKLKELGWTINVSFESGLRCLISSMSGL